MKHSNNHHRNPQKMATLALCVLLAATGALSEPVDKGYNLKSRPNDQTVNLIELVRHGSRGPNYLVQTPPWVVATNYKSLSKAGERMHFAAGKDTYYRFQPYFDSVGRDLRMSQFFVRSTNGNNTHGSGQSHIYGALNRQQAKKLIFANSDYRVHPPQPFYFNPAYTPFSTPLPANLQPIPIYSAVSKNYDLFFSYSGPCPAVKASLKKHQKEVFEELEGSTEVIDLVNQVLDYYNLPHDWMIDELDLAERCYALADYSIQDWHNNPYAVFAPNKQDATKKRIFELLWRCYSLKQVAEYKKGQTNARVLISEMMQEILSFFAKSIQGTNPLKYVLYSGHEGALIAHLYAQGLLKHKCLVADLLNGSPSSEASCANSPRVASSYIWQLLKKKSTGQHAIKVTYNAVSIDYCQNGQKDEYGDYICYYSDFVNYVSNQLIYPNYLSYCQYGFQEALKEKVGEAEEDVGVDAGAVGGLVAAVATSGVGMRIVQWVWIQWMSLGLLGLVVVALWMGLRKEISAAKKLEADLDKKGRIVDSWPRDTVSEAESRF